MSTVERTKGILRTIVSLSTDHGGSWTEIVRREQPVDIDVSTRDADGSLWPRPPLRGERRIAGSE